ncbi:MAG: hypothetical protein BWY11_00622 [Firmicutes bacterium ADurb.Bin182]|nr:MAG: hypothetical protein BWY11_00622 [Firmicutes bacterium ADurb.Bin182]
MSKSVFYCAVCGRCGVLTSYYDNQRMNCTFCGHEMQNKGYDNWDELSEEERAALKEKWRSDAKEKGTLNEELYLKRASKNAYNKTPNNIRTITEIKTTSGEGSLWIGFGKFIAYSSIVFTAIIGAIIGSVFNSELGGFIGFVIGLFVGAVAAVNTMLLITIAENTLITANNITGYYKQCVTSKDAGFTEYCSEAKTEVRAAPKELSEEDKKILKEKAEEMGVSSEYLKWKEENSKK